MRSEQRALYFFCKKIKSLGVMVFELCIQTNRSKCNILALLSGSEGKQVSVIPQAVCLR